MKIGFSTNAYTERSLEYAIKSISDTGYQGIELVLDSPHIFLPITESKIKEYKKKLKKYELVVSNLNANTVEGFSNHAKNKFEPSLSNNDKNLRCWRINYIKNAIDLANELDCPNICITSGIKTNDKKSQKLFDESLREISNYAEKKQVQIAIEYEPGLLIQNANEVLPYVSEFNNVGLNFDVCHAYVNGESMTKIIRTFKKKIFHTHLSDGKNKKHIHLMLGTGEIDFNAMYKELRDVNYTGFLTAELYTYYKNPEEAAKNAFIYIKKMMR